MATNDYLSLIYQNPYVPYANNGFQRDRWCNAIVSMTGSTKGLTVFVYANTANLATQYATQLSQYVQNNPIGNDQITTGLAFPVYDDVSQGYMVRIQVLAGALTIGNSREMQYVGPFDMDCFNECFWTTETCDEVSGEYKFQFERAFSTAFFMRSTATTKCREAIGCHGRDVDERPQPDPVIPNAYSRAYDKSYERI